MLFQSITLIFLASTSIAQARGARRHIDVHRRATATSSDDTSLTLAQDAISSGSFSDGLQEIGGNEASEAASATSRNNFINFCAGDTLTNGLQIVTGSCNGIPMGQIPAKTKMMSSIITFPLAGSATIKSDTTFNITVQMSNIAAGSFSNAASTYFSAPQQLDASGVVIGHTHVTVQDMGSSLNPTGALDPTQFAFFKGINDVGNGQGLLSATVTGGLPAGNYRVCTLASSTNHQPVIMPVAQRGTADDCTKFTVIGSGTTANAASDNGSGGQAAAALAASAVAAGPDNTDSTTSSSSTSTVISASSASSASECAPQATKFTTIFANPGVATSTSSAIAFASSTATAGSSSTASSTAALGGITAPAVTNSGDSTRPFSVNGNTFVNEAGALQRSCDIQFNACANAVNGGTADGFDLSDCQTQENTCQVG
ncbi:b06cce19-b591-4a0b-a262-65bcd4eca5ed [Sclerotinia trifoliorum]|uniref:B06cce19-b591-4a0b-a262-65bcd4eca5ed n=1 Tax=Sclerotinia trifoliorum TaxID=28548 RepID=A0A8H2VU96_9HELO|nr:b06cce19-b591-4a0b-a262-65bcd4eca5ed [Sclerotinia trifoliorum]